MRIARAWPTYDPEMLVPSGSLHLIPRTSRDPWIRDSSKEMEAGRQGYHFREYPSLPLGRAAVGRCLMQTHRFSKPSDIFLPPPVQASLRDSRQRLRRRFYEWWRLIKSDVGRSLHLPSTILLCLLKPPLDPATRVTPPISCGGSLRWYIDRRTTLALLD